MNFQYYDTLQNQSKEYLLQLMENFVPTLTKSELMVFLNDVSSKPSNNMKGIQAGKCKGFIEIGNDQSGSADFNNLTKTELKNIYQVFISRERNDNIAIKWRFYQNLRINRDLEVAEIQIKQVGAPEDSVNMVITTEDGESLLVLCHNIIEKVKYEKSIENLHKFVKSEFIPNRVIFAVHKAHRNIPLEQELKFERVTVFPELWIEWEDIDRPYGGEDLIIVGEDELSFGGFNFTSLDELLDYVFTKTNGGQIRIFKELDYFAEGFHADMERELIWKGIMLKK
ncbi:MAG: hypothetical protein ACFFCS_15885 [Candidatus Hodarchaeota archaeon]